MTNQPPQRHQQNGLITWGEVPYHAAWDEPPCGTLHLIETDERRYWIIDETHKTNVSLKVWRLRDSPQPSQIRPAGELLRSDFAPTVADAKELAEQWEKLDVVRDERCGYMLKMPEEDER